MTTSIPELSIVICTLNRGKLLRDCLASLMVQTLPQERFEIIIVDNGSKDNTKSVAEECGRNFVNCVYAPEPEEGLSRARNRGWRSARGKIVAFLDDDSLASPDWLECIAGTFRDVRPPPACVGGKIDLVWEAPPPPWVSELIEGPLGRVNWSATPGFLTADQYFAGGNMAFPKSILSKYGGFRESLGRRGSKLLSNEELFMKLMIEQGGGRCYYNPAILVRHRVLTFRARRRWFLKRYFWQGISDAVAGNLHDAPSFGRRVRAFLSGCVLFLRKLCRGGLPLSAASRPENFKVVCDGFHEFGQGVGSILYR